MRFFQLALDLFDSPASSPTPALEAAPSQRPPQPPSTPAPAPAATPPSAPAVPLSDAIAPARFAHPGANRATVLAGTHVRYELKRARRRTIGFVVGADGLVVSAPRWVPLGEIESALQEKSSWILRKLEETRQRQDRIDASRIEWRDGASFPFLGETVILVLDARHADAGATLNTDAEALPGVPRLTLHVGLPQHAGPEQIRDAVQSWLMRQAKRLFTERLDHFAPQLGVQWRKLSLSSASTRWGTASADGAIRLNWRLVHFRLPVIDYVVAHELSHLRVMDHSPRFWDTVASVMPDYAARRGELQSEPLAPWK